ncbi:hypothetical protein HMPREF2975_00260 [Actinomyces sp. HMSC065F12]|nr:hypothetical protein HMPREF2975_00260 [Actinomyces sp. HMSC065F12]
MLSLLMGGVDGIVMMNILAVINASIIALTVWRDIDWKRWVLLGPIMVVGSIPGALLVRSVSPAWVQVIVGALITVSLIATVVRGAKLRPVDFADNQGVEWFCAASYLVVAHRSSCWRDARGDRCGSAYCSSSQQVSFPCAGTGPSSCGRYNCPDQRYYLGFNLRIVSSFTNMTTGRSLPRSAGA